MKWAVRNSRNVVYSGFAGCHNDAIILWVFPGGAERLPSEILSITGSIIFSRRILRWNILHRICKWIGFIMSNYRVSKLLQLKPSNSDPQCTEKRRRKQKFSRRWNSIAPKIGDRIRQCWHLETDSQLSHCSSQKLFWIYLHCTSFSESSMGRVDQTRTKFRFSLIR